MAFLSQADKDSIAEAIRQAEQKTSGELVTVIASESDGYHFIPLLWASVVALLVPGALWFLAEGLGAHRVYELQLAAFLVLGVVFRWRPLKMLLISKAAKHGRASRLAHEQFYRQGLHLTEGRTGILLFVSVAERYVEIIADQGIHGRIKAGAWDGIVRGFVEDVRRDRIREGFLTAVRACGALLAEHFPRSSGDIDELPNHLIEI